MEIDDEDVVARGTDLHKYLHSVGCSKYEISEPKVVKNLCLPDSYKKIFESSSRELNQSKQNNIKNYGLYINLIKIIIESQLMFKEDTLFIKEFIPSNQCFGYLSVFTKQNSMIVSIFFICIFINTFFSKYCDKWITICTLILWFGYVLTKIFYTLNQNITTKKKVLKTVNSMNKYSLLVHKTTHFIQECNNLHGVYCCGLSHQCTIKNADSFKYLLMPELKTLLLTTLNELIDNLVYNISKIQKFFPLKDSVSSMVYLYLTDCKIDTQNTSLENLNKAKYAYYLLQSEFLKLTVLCCCQVLWKPDSSSNVNHLIKTFGEFEQIYSSSYSILYEEYNLYLLFKNNNTEHDKLVPSGSMNAVSDLKSKVYSIRHFLQNMMVHVRFMEDSIESSPESCTNDLTNTLNVLVKEVGIFNEFISSLQIKVLKTLNKSSAIQNTILSNEPCDDKNDTEINNTFDSVCEDELFVGVSEEPGIDSADCKVLNDEVFDKSNNRDLILELKVALENKQVEWKIRENKLLEKNPHLKNYEETNEILQQEKNSNKIRKVALDLPFEEGNNIMQLPSTSFANEIAMIACKWKTDIKSIGDDSD